MFTGLIEDCGVLHTRTRSGNAGKLTVQTSLPLAEIGMGDSIAVNGACLTVEEIRAAEGVLVFHTLAETLDRTNLGALPEGAVVNLERALQAGARLGGHFVLGHIDTTSQIADIRKTADDIILTVKLPEQLAPLVIPKGSIAIDGISLTIANLARDTFSVHIIPHTWGATNLTTASQGGLVNLEADMIGKYILRQKECGREESPVTMNLLEQAGFTDE